MAQCGQVACCGGFVWHSVDKWRVVADLYGTVWTSGVLWRICVAQCEQVACCGGFVWHSVDKWRVVADLCGTVWTSGVLWRIQRWKFE